MRIIKKMLIIIAFICIISMLLPNYHAMAQHDGNSQEGLRPQQKGKTQEEVKPSEEWKTRQEQKRLEEWKAWHERKKLEEWKARQAQKKLNEWKAQEERKKLEEWKERNGWKGEKYPYGGYYHSPREGKYGQRRTIRTEAEARKMLLNYFSPQKATIGAIREKGWFFEAEIKDRHNIPIDRVIIDKRTGRIRSIY
jgi:hypothetical protein